MLEANQATAARGLVRQIVSADTAKVPDIIRAIKPSDRRWTDPELKQIGADAPENSKEKLHASLALLPVEPGQVEYLYRRLLNANPDELPVIRKALDGHQAELVDKLWAVLENTQASPDQRFCAACALAGYEPGATEERWLSASGFITKTAARVGDQEPQRLCAAPGNPAPDPETTAGFAVRHLPGRAASRHRAVLRHQHPDRLRRRPAGRAGGSADGRRREGVSGLFPVVQGREAETVPLFQAEIGKKATYEWNDPPRDAILGRARLGQRRAGSNRPVGWSPNGLPSARPCRWLSS